MASFLLYPSRRLVPRSTAGLSFYLHTSRMKCWSRVFPSRSFQTTSPFPGSSSVPPDFAFAFDIDGVLMHGKVAYPPATKALKLLNSKNIEFLLLTNGGGKHEADRVRELSDRLGVEIDQKQFVQSHTPFKRIAEEGGEYGRNFKTVLVMGGNAEKCRQVACGYGFKDVVITADLLAHEPRIWPFSRLSESARATARPLPSDPLKIDAIFVFNDPMDWALDIQIILDLLLSKDGILGTYSPKNHSGDYQRDGQPFLYFSNPDLLWASDYHLPRLGQGGFRNALEGVWRNITAENGLEKQKELECIIIGKPHSHTYRYAEGVLEAWRKERLLAGTSKEHAPLKTIYMVGDNPASDIKGANDFNDRHESADWFSVLVETGVYKQHGDASPPPKYAPMRIVKDVWEAVQFALEREENRKI